ncbi:hypothetical protein V8E36_007487 [Tilletia maclaganii]
MTHSSTRRYFCGCIPTRIAVLVLSALTFLGAMVNAGAVFFTVRDYHDKASPGSKAVLIADGAVVTLLGICSAAGFVGAIIRNRRFVRLYASAMWTMLFFGVVFGAAATWIAFKDREVFVRNCVENTSGANSSRSPEEGKEACERAFKPLIGATIAVLIVMKRSPPMHILVGLL